MNNVITYQEWFYYAKLYKKELIHVFTILVIIVLCGIYAVSQSFSLCEQDETISVQPTDTDIFSQAKAEYEAKSGKKIYPAGERCLRKAAAHCTTKEQVYDIIVQNMK